MTTNHESESLPLDAERRKRFRIEDTAILEIASATEADVAQLPVERFFSPSAGFMLMRELQEIDSDNQSLQRQISERYSDIALYLNALNKKIETIGNAVAERILPEGQKLQAIDLSEGGIGFNHDNKMAEGAYYAIKIWFHRALIGISVFIRVVACNRAIDGGYHISAAFYNLPDAERKTIARHIMSVQAAQQRSKKAQDAANEQSIR